jgi:ABC-type dipeptide/oligopeptide/nickel transport system ATPase subunit
VSGARFALRGVVKSYPGRGGGLAVLAGIDLDLAEGAITALTGRSGAGKSTLARIIMGFTRADGGSIRYRGLPLEEAPRLPFCRENQMVFQNPLLACDPLFSVARIISEPLRVQRLAHDGGETLAAMEEMELPRALLPRRPDELSGGELQRVALARALVLRPGFLVLDEPFSALDDLTALRLVRLLKAACRRRRLGALFISHHRRHIRELADGEVVLERGRLAAVPA